MMKKYITMAIAASALCAGSGFAEEPLVEPKDQSFTYGGDLRLRYVFLDNIPYTVGGTARGGENRFQRYRTRVWGEYRISDELFVRGRLVNEFRTSQLGSASDGWNSMDETIIDTLFVDWQAADDLSVRVGRQDLIYGTGKLILDGTPKDGSRSIYFNAAKFSYTGIANTTIDLLGMYMPAEDEWAIHSQDRDLVGKASNNYGGAEAGGGIYAKNHSVEKLPFEAYYLIKTQEEEWARPGITSASGILQDDETRHTIGTRLMPQFNDTLSANIELAYQTGDDISAYMIDALLTQKIPALEEQKAAVGLGWYCLSGDDPDSERDEGWNPLWARWPQYSELYVYAFDTDGAGRWSNVSMPHLDFTICPTEKLKTDLLLGYMFAPEADAVGGGDQRGWLFTCNNTFTLGEKMLSEHDKLTGHLLLELLDPSNYYNDTQQDDMAIFARVELNYSF